MRIAWFAHRYHPFRGGSENFSRAMVRRFVQAGHSVDVFTSDAYDLWYFTNRRYQRATAPAVEWLDGARVHRLRVRHYPGQRYVGRLLSYLPSWSVQCCFDSYMPIVPGLTRVRGDFDAVVAIGFPYTGFAYGAHQTARAAEAPLMIVPFLHLGTPDDVVHRTYSRSHQKRLLRAADCVVVQTKRESDAVTGWGVDARQVLTLGMGLDQDDVTGGDRSVLRQSLGIPGRAFVIGQLGANDPNKGTCDLVRAVEQLNQDRGIGQEVHLVLAGSESPDFTRFASGLPVASQRWLHRLGIIADGDRRHFYASLDCFAMPSRTDSFGIVFLEAWANGLPVVAADAGGVTDVIAHGQRGLLVPFGNVDALAATLNDLIAHPDAALRLGNAGKLHVAGDTFRWDSRADILLSRLDAMIDTRNARIDSNPRASRVDKPHAPPMPALTPAGRDVVPDRVR